jgi:hypothetical protein
LSQIVHKVKDLESRASNLETAAGTILWIGLLGSVIIIIVGFIPVCPPGDSGCYSGKTASWDLVGTGVGSALSVWLLFALSSVIAGRAFLAAAVANPTIVTPSESADSPETKSLGL